MQNGIRINPISKYFLDSDQEGFYAFSNKLSIILPFVEIYKALDWWTHQDTKNHRVCPKSNHYIYHNAHHRRLDRTCKCLPHDDSWHADHGGANLFARCRSYPINVSHLHFNYVDRRGYVAAAIFAMGRRNRARRPNRRLYGHRPISVVSHQSHHIAVFRPFCSQLIHL